MPNKKLGTLYVVATPIGNLMDISNRAINTLKEVDLIAAEDTRHSATLLNHFNISTPTLSLHNFNEVERTQQILDRLLQGQTIALISDAGTPLISDPGFKLVRAAKNQNMSVIPIPGSCAAIAALSVSGLPTDKFLFAGFLPVKEEACKSYLRELMYETSTLIFYISPHRLLASLKMVRSVFDDEREACLARELTKIYEHVMTGSLQTIVDHYEVHPDQCRGEIVLLISGMNERQEKNLISTKEVLTILLNDLPVKQAATLASKITGHGKNELYQLALQMKKD